jgi:hypothetical protein
LEGPEKGNSAQVAKEEGRIADGGETTADIGDDKDKENNVKACDPIAIHPNPGSDEEHGSASGSEHDLTFHSLFPEHLINPIGRCSNILRATAAP